MTATAQEIEVGPVRVDTGNDWLDLGFAVMLLVVLALVVVWVRR